MVFGCIASSPRGTLSPQQVLNLAKIYLDNACRTNDPDIAMVLCHDTEVSLSHAKKNVKHTRNQSLTEGIAGAYIDLGKLLESRGHFNRAQASFKKAEKLGGNVRESNRTAKLSQASSFVLVEPLQNTLRPIESSRAESLRPECSRVESLQAASSRAPSSCAPSLHAPSSRAPSSHAPSSRVESLRAESIRIEDSRAEESVASTLEQEEEPQQNSEVSTIPEHIFEENIYPPTIALKLPEPTQRLDNTPQLVQCLSLLKASQLPDHTLEPTALKWTQTIGKDTQEQERLHAMAMDVIRAFQEDDIKDPKAVAEVLSLAPVLDKDAFQDLFREFCSGIDSSGQLNIHQLEGLAQLIQNADPGHLNSDDLVKILGLLNTRLADTQQQQSSQHMHQLTLAVSHILDAMADTKTDLDREKLHEPLSSYLNALKQSSDPFLVYQAAYASQALLCVPDQETTWQAAMRRTGKWIQGVSGLVRMAKGLDFVKFIQGLENIQETSSKESNVIFVSTTYDGVSSLVAEEQNFTEPLKEAVCMERKREWYPALRGADILIRDGELTTFRKLVCEAPCRYDPAFQWGVCQRLGEMATNPKWDAATRRSAIAFLGEIYMNDQMWGQEASVKQWILSILMRLSTPSEDASQDTKVASTLLQELETVEDVEKKALSRAWRERGATSYPLKVALPEPISSSSSPSSLLNRVQDEPDFEKNIRLLRKQRTKGKRKPIYIPLYAKSSLHVADKTRYPLMDKVKEFLRSDQRVFLLLGDSGAGKSAFSRELELDLWKSYKTGAGGIPLFIHLPTIDQPEHDMIAKQLKKADFTESQIQAMRQSRKFVLICDGYDESQQTHNLYITNRLNQPGGWNARMVICCRGEYLGPNYRDQFQPGDRNQQMESPLFQEAVITPFSMKEIQEYIKNYVSVNQPAWSAEDYQKALNHIPNLKGLMANPFLATLSMHVLPRLVNSGQPLSGARVTRIALHEHFIKQWLKRSKKRLSDKDMTPQAKEAFEKLSTEGFASSGIKYLKKLAVAIYKEQGGHPVVEYSPLADQGSWKNAFFNTAEALLLQEACPLTKSGDQYQFVHRSLLEYGLVRAVFDPQAKRNKPVSEATLVRQGTVSSTMSVDTHGDKEDVATVVEQELEEDDSPLVWKSFVNEPSLLQFLAERVQQEPAFEKQLLAYIEQSKTDLKWHTAAANSITILVRAGVQFIGTDLQGVGIPGADLSYGVFDSVQLQGANMKNVNLRGAWLRQADLSKAHMAGVQLGELPYLTVESVVESCAYSPDGELFAVGLGSGDIDVYSASSWRRIQGLQGHGKAVQRVVFSPKGDWIASGSRDCTVRLWHAMTGECRRVITDHTEAVYCVTYSPQGDQVASASGDKTVKVWDPVTGDCHLVLCGHERGVLSVAYAPKGDQIVSGSADFTVRLWNVQTGECTLVFKGHMDAIRGVAFSPRGDQVASASYDKTVRLWNVKTGDCRHTLEGHGDKVNSIVYSPKGDQVLTGSQDGSVRVWDAQSGAWRYALAGEGKAFSCATYSPKGDKVVCGSSDKIVRFWDVSVQASRHFSSAHSEGVLNVKCSPQGNLIASCSGDRTIRLWDAETGICRRILNGHEGSVCKVAFSPQGHQIASGGHDNNVLVWDVETGACQLVLTGHTDQIHGVAYSPEGDQIVSSSKDKTVRIWDVMTGECCRTLTGHTDDVRNVAYSPDGTLIATGSEDFSVRLWDVGTMETCRVLGKHYMWVNDVAFSPPGDQLATACFDGMARLWNVKNGECDRMLSHHDMVVSVAYSPKGDLLATSSMHKQVRIWDVRTGQCRAVIQHFQERVTSVAWTPSEEEGTHFLVTGCMDGSVVKWRVMEETEGPYRVVLCWRASKGSLVDAGASFDNVRGLTTLDTQLLEQRRLVAWKHEARMVLPRLLFPVVGHMEVAMMTLGVLALLVLILVLLKVFHVVFHGYIGQ